MQLVVTMLDSSTGLEKYTIVYPTVTEWLDI